MKYDVFISYSRKDTAIADQICAAFDKAGISYFIDRSGISGGEVFTSILAENILNCQIFLFLGSMNSYESKYAPTEVSYAFNHKPKNSLLPYLIDDTPLPKDFDFTFSNINIRNLKSHPIETLIEDVKQLLSRKQPKQENEGNNQDIDLDLYVENDDTVELTTLLLNSPSEKYHTGTQLIPTKSIVTRNIGFMKQKEIRWGYKDEADHVVIPFEFEEAKSFSEGLAAVKDNDQWGYIDSMGNIIIPLQYKDADSFSEGLARIKSKGKWGFIDQTGNFIIDCQYDLAWSFSDGLAYVEKKGKQCFINKNGENALSNVEYKIMDSFSYGFAKVEKYNKYGFINKLGKLFIPYVYDQAHNFYQGFAFAKKDNKWGILDEKGRFHTNYSEFELLDDFSENLAIILMNGMKGFIDTHRNIVIPCEYQDAMRFEEGLAFVKKNDKWGCINTLGTIIIPFDYDEAKSFQNGVAMVKKNEKWGIIDNTGKTLIPFNYSSTLEMQANKSIKEFLSHIMPPIPSFAKRTIEIIKNIKQDT